LIKIAELFRFLGDKSDMSQFTHGSPPGVLSHL
jgi:hypothetical protein